MILLPAIVLIIVTLTYIGAKGNLFTFSKKTNLERRLFKNGVEAPAILLDIQRTGLYVNNLPQVMLQMQVQPNMGRNFVTEAKEVLTPVHFSEIHIGSTLKVKYNPANTKEVMLVKQ